MKRMGRHSREGEKAMMGAHGLSYSSLSTFKSGYASKL
jgi:hypothetical protein